MQIERLKNQNIKEILWYFALKFPESGHLLTYDWAIFVKSMYYCNTLSFFVSQCFKQLPKPMVLVSYADTSQNHHGYIYQATNWIYTGLSNKFTDYAVKGLEHMHHSSIEDSVGRYDKNKNIDKHTLLKEKYGDKLYLKERPRKHRYFYFLGTKKDKKIMLKNLSYTI